MAFINNSLFKTNSYLCLISADTDKENNDYNVVLVDRNKKEILVNDNFHEDGENILKLSKVFRYFHIPESIVNEFKGSKENLVYNDDVLKEFNAILNHKHDKYEIGYLNKEDDVYFATYKIYDVDPTKDANLINSGELVFSNDTDEEIVNMLDELGKSGGTEVQKKYLIQTVLPEIESSLNEKMECDNCGKIVKIFLFSAPEMPDGVHIIDNMKSYSQSDYDQFKKDIKNYGLQDCFENCGELPQDVRDVQYIVNTPHLLEKFNDRKLRFETEVKDMSMEQSSEELALLKKSFIDKTHKSNSIGTVMEK